MKELTDEHIIYDRDVQKAAMSLLLINNIYIDTNINVHNKNNFESL